MEKTFPRRKDWEVVADVLMSDVIQMTDPRQGDVEKKEVLLNFVMYHQQEDLAALMLLLSHKKLGVSQSDNVAVDPEILAL